MSFRMDWNGDELAERVHKAELTALDDTGARMVDRARSSHPGWHDRTGEADRSIQRDDAQRTESGARMAFGSTLGRFIFLEIGTRGRAGDHTLRRAKDAEAGHLAERVKAELKK